MAEAATPRTKPESRTLATQDRVPGSATGKNAADYQRSRFCMFDKNTRSLCFHGWLNTKINRAVLVHLVDETHGLLTSDRHVSVPAWPRAPPPTGNGGTTPGSVLVGQRQVEVIKCIISPEVCFWCNFTQMLPPSQLQFNHKT